MKYLLFLFLCSCASVAAAPKRPVTVPLAINIRADILFSDRERALIEEAAIKLRNQTSGQLIITVSYEADVTEMTLLRVRSNYPQVSGLDASFNGMVFGWTSLYSHRMFLVDDRLGDDDVFVHVAMHEILHSIGLDHSKSTSSVMFETTNAAQHATCLDRTDAVQFCKIVGCQSEKLNYCGR